MKRKRSCQKNILDEVEGEILGKEKPEMFNGLSEDHTRYDKGKTK